MAKIAIDDTLYDRAKKAVASVGYSSVEEFVVHCLENELKRLKLDEAEEQVQPQQLTDPDDRHSQPGEQNEQEQSGEHGEALVALGSSGQQSGPPALPTGSRLAEMTGLPV